MGKIARGLDNFIENRIFSKNGRPMGTREKVERSKNIFLAGVATAGVGGGVLAGIASGSPLIGVIMAVPATAAAFVGGIFVGMPVVLGTYMCIKLSSAVEEKNNEKVSAHRVQPVLSADQELDEGCKSCPALQACASPRIIKAQAVKQDNANAVWNEQVGPGKGNPKPSAESIVKGYDE